MKNSISHAVIIPADVNHVACAVTQLLSFLQDEAEVDDECLFDIKLILNELIVNAIVHGNKEDRTKQVFAELYICNYDRIIIIVEDQGRGRGECQSSTGKIPAQDFCDDDIWLWDERGRGLTLVSSLCKCMRFNKRGNKVVILKELNVVE